MKFEVSDKELVTLANEANVEGEIVVDENAFTFMIGVYFVVNQISFGH